MKKILSFLLIGLLLSVYGYSANTIVLRDNSVLITSDQIQTTSTNSTTTMDLGPYRSGSVQCAWQSITGVQPIFKLQVSNNGTNWDDVSGASTTTTAGSGSSTWLVEPFISRYARVYVSTTSTTGTLNCVTVADRP